MANDSGMKMRFRPVGTAKKRAEAAVYGPLDTGCPAVSTAIAALYTGQNEASFWALMNALNYALQLETRVLVPLQSMADPQGKAVTWAERPVPADKAEGLPLWLLRTNKGKNYLPVFLSVKAAEADKGTAARPMSERLLMDVMKEVLDTEGIDGIVIDPWNSSATLECSILNGLLRAQQDTAPGETELEEAEKAIAEKRWDDARYFLESAASLGRAEALTRIGELYYTGSGVRKSAAQARKFWKKAAKAGEVEAMLVLGDDVIHSGGDRGEALLYYRRAASEAAATPDITYTPRLQLRLAQHETRFLSKKKALAQLAEAKQGFAILVREGDESAKPWLEETEKEIKTLL